MAGNPLQGPDHITVGLGADTTAFNSAISAAANTTHRFVQAMGAMDKSVVAMTKNTEVAALAQQRMDKIIEVAGTKYSGIAGAVQHASQVLLEFVARTDRAAFALASFSAGAAATFVTLGKEINNVATASAQATVNLQSLSIVVKSFGKDADAAQDAAKSLASDGLLSVAQASTSLRNLLSNNSVSIAQATTLIERLKDAASANPKSGFTLADQIAKTTEGIRLGLSTLSDNAGIPENLSQLETKYAKAIGKTRIELTEEEKILARVTEMTKLAVVYEGAAIARKGSLLGAQDRLNASQTAFVNTIGAVYIPIMRALTQAFDTVVKAATSVSETFPGLIQNATGVFMLFSGLAAAVGLINVAAVLAAGSMLAISNIMGLWAATGKMLSGSFGSITGAMGSMTKTILAGKIQTELNTIATKESMAASRLAVLVETEHTATTEKLKHEKKLLELQTRTLALADREQALATQAASGAALTEVEILERKNIAVQQNIIAVQMNAAAYEAAAIETGKMANATNRAKLMTEQETLAIGRNTLEIERAVVRAGISNKVLAEKLVLQERTKLEDKMLMELGQKAAVSLRTQAAAEYELNLAIEDTAIAEANKRRAMWTSKGVAFDYMVVQQQLIAETKALYIETGTLATVSARGKTAFDAARISAGGLLVEMEKLVPATERAAAVTKLLPAALSSIPPTAARASVGMTILNTVLSKTAIAIKGIWAALMGWPGFILLMFGPPIWGIIVDFYHKWVNAAEEAKVAQNELISSIKKEISSAEDLAKGVKDTAKEIKELQDNVKALTEAGKDHAKQDEEIAKKKKQIHDILERLVLISPKFQDALNAERSGYDKVAISIEGVNAALREKLRLQNIPKPGTPEEVKQANEDLGSAQTAIDTARQNLRDIDDALNSLGSGGKEKFVTAYTKFGSSEENKHGIDKAKIFVPGVTETLTAPDLQKLKEKNLATLKENEAKLRAAKVVIKATTATERKNTAVTDQRAADDELKEIDRKIAQAEANAKKQAGVIDKANKAAKGNKASGSPDFVIPPSVTQGIIDLKAKRAAIIKRQNAAKSREAGANRALGAKSESKGDIGTDEKADDFIKKGEEEIAGKIREIDNKAANRVGITDTAIETLKKANLRLEKLKKLQTEANKLIKQGLGDALKGKKIKELDIRVLEADTDAGNARKGLTASQQKTAAKEERAAETEARRVAREARKAAAKLANDEKAKDLAESKAINQRFDDQKQVSSSIPPAQKLRNFLVGADGKGGEAARNFGKKTGSFNKDLIDMAKKIAEDIKKGNFDPKGVPKSLVNLSNNPLGDGKGETNSAKSKATNKRVKEIGDEFKADYKKITDIRKEETGKQLDQTEADSKLPIFLNPEQTKFRIKTDLEQLNDILAWKKKRLIEISKKTKVDNKDLPAGQTRELGKEEVDKVNEESRAKELALTVSWQTTRARIIQEAEDKRVAFTETANERIERQAAEYYKSLDNLGLSASERYKAVQQLRVEEYYKLYAAPVTAIASSMLDSIFDLTNKSLNLLNDLWTDAGRTYFLRDFGKALWKTFTDIFSAISKQFGDSIKKMLLEWFDVQVVRNSIGSFMKAFEVSIKAGNDVNEARSKEYHDRLIEIERDYNKESIALAEALAIAKDTNNTDATAPGIADALKIIKEKTASMTSLAGSYLLAGTARKAQIVTEMAATQNEIDLQNERLKELELIRQAEKDSVVQAKANVVALDAVNDAAREKLGSMIDDLVAGKGINLQVGNLGFLEKMLHISPATVAEITGTLTQIGAFATNTTAAVTGVGIEGATAATTAAAAAGALTAGIVVAAAAVAALVAFVVFVAIPAFNHAMNDMEDLNQQFDEGTVKAAEQTAKKLEFIANKKLQLAAVGNTEHKRLLADAAQAEVEELQKVIENTKIWTREREEAAEKLPAAWARARATHLAFLNQELADIMAFNAIKLKLGIITNEESANEEATVAKKYLDNLEEQYKTEVKLGKNTARTLRLMSEQRTKVIISDNKAITAKLDEARDLVAEKFNAGVTSEKEHIGEELKIAEDYLNAFIESLPKMSRDTREAFLARADIKKWIADTNAFIAYQKRKVANDNLNLEIEMLNLKREFSLATEEEISNELVSALSTRRDTYVKSLMETQELERRYRLANIVAGVAVTPDQQAVLGGYKDSVALLIKLIKEMQPEIVNASINATISGAKEEIEAARQSFTEGVIDADQFADLQGQLLKQVYDRLNKEQAKHKQGTEEYIRLEKEKEKTINALHDERLAKQLLSETAQLTRLDNIKSGIFRKVSKVFDDEEKRIKNKYAALEKTPESEKARAEEMAASKLKKGQTLKELLSKADLTTEERLSLESEKATAYGEYEGIRKDQIAKVEEDRLREITAARGQEQQALNKKVLSSNERQRQQVEIDTRYDNMVTAAKDKTTLDTRNILNVWNDGLAAVVPEVVDSVKKITDAFKKLNAISNVTAAQANVDAKTEAVTAAEALSEGDVDKDKKITTARKELALAKTGLADAKAAEASANTPNSLGKAADDIATAVPMIVSADKTAETVIPTLTPLPVKTAVDDESSTWTSAPTAAPTTLPPVEAPKPLSTGISWNRFGEGISTRIRSTETEEGSVHGADPLGFVKDNAAYKDPGGTYRYLVDIARESSYDVNEKEAGPKEAALSSAIKALQDVVGNEPENSEAKDLLDFAAGLYKYFVNRKIAWTGMLGFGKSVKEQLSVGDYPSFAKGALLPNSPRYDDLPVKVHAGEMILPSKITQPLLQMIQNGEINGGGSASINFNGDISVRNDADIEKLAKKVGDEVMKSLKLRGRF